MGMQKYTGKVMGTPRFLETTKNHRIVMHLDIAFMPEVDIFGKLPSFKEDSINRINLSIWDENLQAQVRANPEALVGKVVTGYCDNITKREQFYNGTGYAFVVDPNGKPKAPVFQVITAEAPSAPVAPV